MRDYIKSDLIRYYGKYYTFVWYEPIHSVWSDANYEADSR